LIADARFEPLANGMGSEDECTEMVDNEYVFFFQSYRLTIAFVSFTQVQVQVQAAFVERMLDASKRTANLSIDIYSSVLTSLG
jgi:hypothetical protein